MKIEYKDTSVLNKEEKEVLRSLTEEEVQRLINYMEVREVIIDIRIHSKGGKRKRYELSVRLIGNHMYNTKVEEWDLRKAIHSSFQKLRKEAEHREA